MMSVIEEPLQSYVMTNTERSAVVWTLRTVQRDELRKFLDLDPYFVVIITALAKRLYQEGD